MRLDASATRAVVPQSGVDEPLASMQLLMRAVGRHERYVEALRR
jgi:hypothetical protein